MARRSEHAHQQSRPCSVVPLCHTGRRAGTSLVVGAVESGGAAAAHHLRRLVRRAQLRVLGQCAARVWSNSRDKPRALTLLSLGAQTAAASLPSCASGACARKASPSSRRARAPSSAPPRARQPATPTATPMRRRQRRRPSRRLSCATAMLCAATLRRVGRSGARTPDWQILGMLCPPAPHTLLRDSGDRARAGRPPSRARGGPQRHGGPRRGGSFPPRGAGAAGGVGGATQHHALRRGRRGHLDRALRQLREHARAAPWTQAAAPRAAMQARPVSASRTLSEPSHSLHDLQLTPSGPVSGQRRRRAVGDVARHSPARAPAGGVARRQRVARRGGPGARSRAARR